MKLAIFLTALAIVPASAQLGMKQAPTPAAVAAKPAATLPAGDKPPMAFQTIDALEKEMDTRLAATGGAEPCNVWGASRGVYVNGIGTVFTAVVELVTTPGGMSALSGFSADQKAKYHKSMLAHVPLLEQTMRDMVLSVAASPAVRLADTDQIVVSVRLFYRPWEDMTGLPGQIVVRLDHRGGALKMEVQ